LPHRALADDNDPAVQFRALRRLCNAMAAHVDRVELLAALNESLGWIDAPARRLAFSLTRCMNFSLLLFHDVARRQICVRANLLLETTLFMRGLNP
jgi:hypothetical protein